MQPESVVLASPTTASLQRGWPAAAVRLAAAWLIIGAACWPEWREMAHQWWDIDTYAHILLIPPILAWLVWLRRAELTQVDPAPFAGGLAVLMAGLALCLAGRALEINLVAQAGAVVALQGAVILILGVRSSLVLAFPLFYMVFLVPFGDEIVDPLQAITARIAVALTHASGVSAALHGLFIDTPAGRFVVAEECSGVKFLIAMTALATLLGWTAFRSWRRRFALLVGAAVISLVANGMRAWGTIYAAQIVGIERAGGIDHIVYGWIFFAVVIGIVLALAWRFFEREPIDAGLTAEQAGMLARRFKAESLSPAAALAMVFAAAFGFAVLARLV